MEPRQRSLLSQLAIAAAFGVAALAIVLAGIHIRMPGTVVVTDPREVFTTIGASLTGPIGGIVIGILAGIAEPDIPRASLLAHIVGGLYSGLVYKNLSWRFRSNDILRLALWAVQVLGYYLLVVVPLFVLGLSIFYPDPEAGPFSVQFATLARLALPEAILTTIVTSIIMAALPDRYRRPLW